MFFQNVPQTLIPPRFWVFWLYSVIAITEVNRNLVLLGELRHWGELEITYTSVFSNTCSWLDALLAIASGVC